MEIKEQKKKLRSSMLCQRMALSHVQVDSKSLALTKHFFTSDILDKVHTCMAFMPFKNEIDITYIVEELLAKKVRIVLPKVDTATNTLQTLAITDLNKDLTAGVWGIKEPLASCEPVLPENIDLILTPGVAFDTKRYRLGYGGGFYDRLLQHTDALTIGVGFDFQRVDEVPREPWDLPLNMLLTETGWY